MLKVGNNLVRHSKTYLEYLMTTTEQDQSVLRIREYITSTAKTLNLKAYFAPVRRKSDIIVVKLEGKHQYACAMIPYLTESFPEIDVDVPGKAQTNGVFTFIVTRKLIDQEAIVKERRAKLKKTLGTTVKAPNQPITQEDLNHTLFLGNI